jgi:hypothetical protein
MMQNKRILNRIIFINIANTDYSSVEIAGNTCFVGTNNMGKTTLQRAILFFYNANTRWLGISSSQKSFEDYYFQYPNSYIIYEVATEEGFFHVMVYRNNKIFYRFVDGEFVKDHYIIDNEAVLPKAVLQRFNEHKISYSDQIETFERYRNIIYGADPEKKYKKFALMKGNANYHNIPLAITSIFLSSESVIKAEFVKECIANSISSKHTTIELKTIERQLRQFTEWYHDIETFFKRENAQRSELIRDNFEHIKQLKIKQRSLAAALGGAIKYAEVQKASIDEQVAEKRQSILQLEEAFKLRELAHQEKYKEANQEVGAFKAKIREANKKLEEYEALGIVDLLREADEKPQLIVELAARQNEYATLTAGFSDIEQQFKTLFSALENERKEMQHVLQAQRLQQERKFQEAKDQLREQGRNEEQALRDQFNSETDYLKQLKNQHELELKDAEFKEKEINRKLYFAQEVQLIQSNIEDIAKRKLERNASLTVKYNSIEGLRKEGDHIREKNRIAAEQYTESNKKSVAEIEAKIAQIDEKLAVHQQAFFGFLQEHYPDWYETIGKVCHEDLLFQKDLNPQLLKKEFDTLYGIKLDLTQVPVRSKSLEQYEQERSSYRDEISTLNQAFLDFREQLTKEEQQKLASIGKKSAQLKSEISQLEYEAAQDEEKLKQYEIDLHTWTQKGNAQKEQDLVAVYTQQKNIQESIAQAKAKLSEMENVLKKNLEKVRHVYEERLEKLTKAHQRELANIQEQMDANTADVDERKAKLQKEKSTVLKKKGIDDTRIKKLKKDIETLQHTLNDLEKNATIINDYRKDKRELFDKMDSFKKDMELLDERIRVADKDFKAEREAYHKRKSAIDEETRALVEQLKAYTNGLEHFEKHFKDRTLYERLKHLIDPEPAQYAEAGIIGLCSQLQANDTEYHTQFEKFRTNISEYSGRFRPDNHFGFKINSGTNDNDYLRFASELQDYYNENRIQVSIAQVAKSHGMLIDAIASKMKALTEHKGRISKIIAKMEADFSKASFEGSKLIEYIKLRSLDSENKVLRKLQKITEFREQNPFLYGEVNLFNQTNKSKTDIDKRSVELLNDLQKTISEERHDEIRVEDLFELQFRIKEGKNDTGWIDKIDKVGSTGTDMLVKAVIYITLLNVFIKESTEKTSRNFSVHCIIDEVGQISAPYLKELIAFAGDRNICLINGLPNESKLETHYNYTYKFRKDSHGYVKVIPLLTISVEP